MFTMAPSRPQARRCTLSMVDWARLYAPNGPPWNIIERLLWGLHCLAPDLEAAPGGAGAPIGPIGPAPRD